MSRDAPIVVVTRPDDLPGFPGRMVEADAFLGGADGLLKKKAEIVNLCRSFRYLSKGYYVSLLADARGQSVIPTVETIEALSNPEILWRRLREADVETVEMAEMKGRRKLLPRGIAPSDDAPGSDLKVYVRELRDDSVVYRPAERGELVETPVLLGQATDPRFRRIGAAVFRLWPVPALRLRLLREEDRWKVIDLAPIRFGSLSREQKDELVRLLLERGMPSAVRRSGERKGISIAILFDEKDDKKPSTRDTVDRLIRVAARMHVYANRIGPGDLARVGEYDALFIRTLTGLQLPAFRFALHAESLGMPVIDDSNSIIRCGNKVFLQELLAREGVPMPPTRTVTRESKFQALRQDLGLPFILKLPDGSFSTAVFKVEDKRTFLSRTSELWKDSPLLVAQAWTPSEFDWRIGVLDGKILYAARYHMASGHWQIREATPSGARYGRVEAVPRDRVPREVARVALRAATLIGDGLYGVDLKELPSGPVVIEVNDNPNIDIGYEDGEDGDTIYREIVAWFVRRVKRRSGKPKARRPVRHPSNGGLASLRAPIGRKSAPPERPYRPFEVCGLELEYVVVDRDLNAVSLVEPFLAALAGRPTSDITLGTIGFSNEIFDHVLELKTVVPLRSLVETEELLVEGVRRAAAVLANRFDARLLGTGMHPWLDPTRARRWRRSNQKVYSAYDRLFDIRSHGWANVQACHVNLPLGRDEEAVAMMNAAALLIPYLPAIAASSPVVRGDPGEAVDGRLHYVLGHQGRIPESCGEVVPETISDLADYRRRILKPMYAAVDRLPDAAALRHEFFNARGAVFKFSRQSMEVRVIDMQECVKMDVAIAAFVRAVLRGLSRRLMEKPPPLPAHDVLVADFRATVHHGSRARVLAPHLAHSADRDEEGRVGVRDVLEELLGIARKNIRRDESDYLDLVAGILENGTLSERMSATFEGLTGDEEFTDAARRLYIRLSECLTENEPWTGGFAR